MSSTSLSEAVKVTQIAQDLIPTRTGKRFVDNAEVEVVCQEFTDRTFVGVTQFGKVGYMVRGIFPTNVQVQAQVQYGQQTAEFLDQVMRSSLSDSLSAPTVTLVPLFGVTPPELVDLYAFYATQIAARICADLHAGSSVPMSQTFNKPVVVGLALKRPVAGDEVDLGAERSRLDAVLALLTECRVW